MSDVLIASRELQFLLWDWLRINDDPASARVDREIVDAILELSKQLAQDGFLTHYKDSDRDEPIQDANGNVRVLPAIRTALAQYAELGLFGVGFEEELGGFALPETVVAASLAQFMAANVATAVYAMLTVANARLIAAFGNSAQVDAFVRPQVRGVTLGTMCLSETQAGSSLADITTRSVADGADELGDRFRLFGRKMWISAGDHDVTDNIVHLVLAKIPNEDGLLGLGTRGISLFIVPKVLPNGERNDLAVAGLNHKMGSRGTSNCLLHFGEGRHSPNGAPGAVGWLIGDRGQGLALMFKMMNEARINVGLGAAAIAYRSYRHAVAYACERTQGRALGAAPGDSGPVSIVEHPDVQRMLLAQKAYAEGALALVLYCARLVDRGGVDDDSSELLALMTPVAKTWPSEWGLVANDLAIQVHGGYGYARDFDVEQLYRDNRLNPIHEGTTGIQALDLLGRKILRSDGRALDVLDGQIAATVRRARGHTALTQHADKLELAWKDVTATVYAVRAVSNPAIALANATPFLSAFGHLIVAWLWLDVAASIDPAHVDSDAFLAGKLRACRFFYACELPKVAVWLEFVRSLDDVAAGVPLEQF